MRKLKPSETRASTAWTWTADGTITKAEFDILGDRRFNKMDQNGDGFITPDEVQAGRGMGGGQAQ